MECLISKLDLELNNDNLPVLDTRVDDYLAALGDNTYRTAIETLYATLKAGNVIDKFNILMPILGGTVDKAILNLIDVNKHIGYNGAIEVGNNSIFADSDGERVAGGYDDVNYTASSYFGVIAVFKRSNTHNGSIFKTNNVSDFMAHPDKNYINVFGSWKDISTGEVGNAYLGTVSVLPYIPDPNNQYIYDYVLGTDSSKIVYSGERTISPTNTFTAPITLDARAELLFFAVSKSLSPDTLDIILPAVKTFVEATKEVTFAPNPA